jgi:sugar lactone lactonase YvrE
MLPSVLHRLCRRSGALAALFALCAIMGSANAQLFNSTPNTLYRIAGGAAKGSADGPGLDARFNSPRALIKFGDSLLVVDNSNHAIRQILSNGYVVPFVGRAGTCGTSDGTGTYSLFCFPRDIAADPAGNLFVLEDYFGAIRKVARVPLGVVSTRIGGTGACKNANGSSVAAQLCAANGIAADAAGNLYFTDGANAAIRKITPAGIVTILAGGPDPGSSLPRCSYSDGTGAAAHFCLPAGIAIDAAGNLYVADSFNCVIRKVTPAGVASTIAGKARTCGTDNGPGASATFSLPYGIAIDAAGNLYVTDIGSSTVRKIANPGGQVTTIAGTACPVTSSPCPTNPGRLPGSIGRPRGVAVIGPNQLAIATDNDEILGINF